MRNTSSFLASRGGIFLKPSLKKNQQKKNPNMIPLTDCLDTGTFAEIVETVQIITQESLWPENAGCPGSWCSWWSCQCCLRPRSVCSQHQFLYTLRGVTGHHHDNSWWRTDHLLCEKFVWGFNQCEPFGQSPLQSSHWRWPSLTTSVLSWGQALTQELPSTTKWAARSKKGGSLHFGEEQFKYKYSRITCIVGKKYVTEE